MDFLALADTVGRIYETVLDDDVERSWLDGARNLIGAEHACLSLVGRHVDWWSCSRFSAVERAIGDRFVAEPMYCAALEQVPQLAPVRLSQVMPIPEMLRTDMYQELIRPMNGGIATIYAWRQGGELNAITICRSAQHDQDFSDDELSALQPLLAHFHNAWQLRTRLWSLQASLDHAHAALDALVDGVVIIDRTCRVRYLNPAASALLHDGAALRLDDLTLRAARQQDEARLQAVLQSALRIARALRSRRPADDRSALRGARSTLCIPREPLRRPLLLSAAPAGSMARLHGVDAFADAAVLLLRDPDRVSAGDAESLAQAFGLTRREAELALALKAGHPLSMAASRMGITEGTARQYLKSVFAKTGVGRQAELVGLLRNIG